MKKILPIILIACMITALSCACNKGPDLDGVAISELAITQTAYQREEKWVAAQGLATDGTYFYYAGHHDKTNEAADIHVIDATTFQEVRTFSRAGAMHSAELYYNKERGTLFACSGDDKRKPYVYELNIADGSRLNEWYFDDLGEKGGGLIAFDDNGDLILFTSSKDGARIGFDVITLGENGAFSVTRSCLFSDTDLGVPQGLEYYDGYVYLMCDAGATVEKNPHYLYKIKLGEQSLTIAAAYRIPMKCETQGICLASDGRVYFGNVRVEIFVSDLPIAAWTALKAA